MPENLKASHTFQQQVEAHVAADKDALLRAAPRVAEDGRLQITLRCADLVDAQLQGANLYNAQLQGAQFYHVEWDATMNAPHETCAQLQGANLRAAQLQAALH